MTVKTELLMHLVPGNTTGLARVPTGHRMPHAEHLAPPEPLRLEKPSTPVDQQQVAWKLKLTEYVYQFTESLSPLGETRVRLLLPKNLEPPSKEWIRRGVENMIDTLN